MKLTAPSLLVISCMLLSSCATPTVVAKVSPAERQTLNCEQIRAEIASAENFQKEARKEDRFKLRYILIAPALVSIWNINEADNAAKKRQVELKELAQQKKCTK